VVVAEVWEQAGAVVLAALEELEVLEELGAVQARLGNLQARSKAWSSQ
jgi:hypothetical protein